jgi:hypothetical protein
VNGFLAALVLLLCFTASKANGFLESPSGPVVLTVEGHLTKPNRQRQAVFDMAMLGQLPQHRVFTKSPWYPEGAEFSGPLLRDVLNAAGASGTRITAYALNDYKTEIPFDDATQYDVILARLMNGKAMPIREKGPLFIVYPFDSTPALHSQVYYNRSAWQLMRLKIE